LHPPTTAPRLIIFLPQINFEFWSIQTVGSKIAGLLFHQSLELNDEKVPSKLETAPDRRGAPQAKYLPLARAIALSSDCSVPSFLDQIWKCLES